MNRRHYLATIAAVAVAGCSDDSDTAAVVPPTGNNSTAGGNQSENNGSADDPPGDPPDDPPGQGEAAEHIAVAQGALEAAVTEIGDQAGYEATFASDFDASVSLNATPVEDELAATRSALDEADEVGLDGSQEATVDAIANAEAFVRAVVAIQPALNDLHADVGYLLEDAKAGEWERVNSDATDIERALDRINKRSVKDPFLTAGADGEMELVDALSTDDVHAQMDRIEGEIEAVGGILDAVETLDSAEITFDDAVQANIDGDNNEAFNLFDDAEGAYGSVSGLSGGHGFAGGTDWLDCYCTHMSEACTYHKIAINRRQDGGDWQEMNERANDEVESAKNCDLSMG